jgi:hypothetical protein
METYTKAHRKKPASSEGETIMYIGNHVSRLQIFLGYLNLEP